MSTISLGDICDLISVQVDPRKFADALYVGLEHVAPGRFVRVGGGIANDVQSSKFTFKRGDILYGKLRPYLDKAILADTDGVCTTELLVLRPKNGIDPRFLIGVVHCRAFISHAISGTTGVQHPRTSWHRISKFEIPDFSADDRARIADLVWIVHHALVACENAVATEIDLKCAAMRELFTRGLRGEARKETEIGLVPESWDVKPLSGYIHKPDYGFTASASSDAVGPRFLRITDIQDGDVDWDNVPYCVCDQYSIASKGLKENDIVVARIGATTGKAFLIKKCPEAIFASYLIRIKADENKLLPVFLYYYMQTDSY